MTDKGSASFHVMRRLGGKVVRRMIGVAWHVPLSADQPLPYSLADARHDARAAILDISRGIDPKAETFTALATEFLADHVSSLRSAREVEAAFKNELLPVFGKRSIGAISDAEIARLLKGIAKDRPYQARHIFAYLSKFFHWAIAQRSYGLKISPCTGLSAKDLFGKPSPRTRIPSDSELAALWLATAGLSYPAWPFVRLLLLTGQRLREVAEMTRPEIDLDKRLWTIPAERMKADAAHVVPLAPEAAAILERLPRWTGTFVFTSTSGRRPTANFSGIKERLDALLPGIDPWRFHDLRRTMRTGLSALRIADTVSELCIAHTQKGLHKVYDQHSYLDEKRRAFELWADRLLSIVEPGDGNVVRLKARR